MNLDRQKDQIISQRNKDFQQDSQEQNELGDSINNNHDKYNQQKYQNNKQLNSQKFQRTDPYIGEKHEAPSFMSENPYLLTGYRINFNTYKLIFKSLFMWHNDTVNIYSHLIPAFLAIIAFIYEILEENTTQLTKMPIYIMIVFGFIMFMNSAGMHLLYPKSKNVCICTTKLDYVGISLFSQGKGMIFICYVLYCDDLLFWGYTSFWIISWQVLLVLSLTDWFHDPKHKNAKIALFFAVGAGLVLPVLHTLYLYSQDKFQDFDPILPIFYQLGILSLFGIGVVNGFAFFFPEKQYPRKFDLIGQSHNILHTLVAIAIICTYFTAKINFNHRAESMTCQN